MQPSPPKRKHTGCKVNNYDTYDNTTKVTFFARMARVLSGCFKIKDRTNYGVDIDGISYVGDDF